MLTHPRVGAVAAVIGLLALGAAPATAVGRAAAALGAEDGYLTGIACVNKANCVAVGNDANPGSVSVTLAELWNGTHWTVLPTPNPVGARGSKFYRSFLLGNIELHCRRLQPRPLGQLSHSRRAMERHHVADPAVAEPTSGHLERARQCRLR